MKSSIPPSTMSGFSALRLALRSQLAAVVLALASFSAQIMSERSTSSWQTILRQISSSLRRYWVDSIVISGGSFSQGWKRAQTLRMPGLSVL